MAKHGQERVGTGAGGGWLNDPMHRAVHALGITQITAWGTSFYCLGVLGNPIAKEMGWTRAQVFLGFTIAVLVMGLISTTVGRAIDRYGARGLMSIGTVVVSAALAALAFVQDHASYLAVWALLGVGMRLCLYDAAFAALVQVAPSRGRTAISYLTLYGAFASSIFWVIGHYLAEQVGWRQTLLIFALVNLVICLPLHWFGLARRESASTAAMAPTAQAVAEGPALEGAARRIGIGLFALIMSLNGFVFGIITVQLVQLIEAAGLFTAAAVWMASLKGFAQFAGRIVEIVFGRNLRAITVARIAIGALPLSFLLLILGHGVFAAVLAFTLLLGAAQGVITIVRGAVPLALFGAKGYGAVLGLIATPVLFVNASAPTVFAWIADQWGWETGRYVLIGCAAASWLAIEAMSFWYERHRRRITEPAMGADPRV
ncbi:MAG: MFS transporter [Hyphomicrobiaceae bacterium]